VSILRRMGQPVRVDRKLFLPGLLDLERRRSAPGISGEELRAKAILGPEGRRKEEECRRQNDGATAITPERNPSPRFARRRLRRNGPPPDTPAARRRSAGLSGGGPLLRGRRLANRGEGLLPGSVALAPSFWRRSFFSFLRPLGPRPASASSSSAEIPGALLRRSRSSSPGRKSFRYTRNG
jgi:hypothetical protein